MKPVLLQTLPAFQVVRDAAFMGEDALLLTDPLANLWLFTLESGQVRQLHRGEDIMALFRGVVPAGGGYPRLAVSPRGDAIVVNTDDFVLAGWEATGDSWSFMSAYWGLYYPDLEFSPNGEYFAAWSEIVIVFDVRGLQHRVTGSVGECAWHPSRPLLLCVDSDNALGWLDLETQKRNDSTEVSPQWIGSLIEPGGTLDAVCGLSFLNDDTFVVAFEWGYVEFWQLKPLRRLDRVQTDRRIHKMKSVPGGRWFTLEGEAGVQVWDAATRAPVSKLLPGKTDVRFSPSGSRFITLGPMSTNSSPMPGRGGGTTVTLWAVQEQP
ncbi:hypothetical protein F0U61_24575 [Archangium violaceum]|uniref:WD40 repeat domain-containing protein n=1 Tax=Archangium violaceum TaxID=83451 RepID=UPI002B2E66CF|nr:hypothetical protein F0U61_24575 [Archangium violaceum]